MIAVGSETGAMTRQTVDISTIRLIHHPGHPKALKGDNLASQKARYNAGLESNATSMLKEGAHTSTLPPQ